MGILLERKKNKIKKRKRLKRWIKLFNKKKKKKKKAATLKTNFLLD